METQQVHSLGDMIVNGTTTSHADLWYNPALLGKRAQFGKLAKSINHFHLLQMALAKIFFQLYFNGENGTFIWCSYHINRKNVLNKAFWTTTFWEPTNAGSWRIMKRKPYWEYSYLAATGDMMRLRAEHSCFISLYFHKDDFSIPTLTYACARQWE